MECCENKNINNRNICINCGIIHGYKYVRENIYRDYNMDISNILVYKNLFTGEKNIYIKNV